MIVDCELLTNNTVQGQLASWLSIIITISNTNTSHRYIKLDVLWSAYNQLLTLFLVVIGKAFF